MAQKPIGMHVEDIKAELRKQFGPLTDVSINLGLARGAVSRVLAQPGYSAKTEIKLAELLGKTPFEVWGPTRFHEDGSPVSRYVDRTPTRKMTARLRQNGVAA